MAANKQDPRYFKYSPFPKRQCAVTGGTTSGVASFLTTSSNLITLNASSTDPVVVTWASGFDPFPVDYAYKWTGNATNAWGPFIAGTYYLYIDYDPSTDTVSYGSTTVVPNDDLIAPSHGPGVHWFDQSKYKMYESVAGVWTERIRVFVGEAISNGSSVTTLITYALNGRYVGPETSIPALGTKTTVFHNIGTNKVTPNFPIICKTAEHNYAIGDIVYDAVEQYVVDGEARAGSPLNGNITRLSLFHTRGNLTTLTINPTTGAGAPLTPANWRYIPMAERRY